MPKGSNELTNSRRDEIINACAKLYETMNFKDITIKEIGNATSFTRTSIYNYFQTKEEIFLALLQREYEVWCDDLIALSHENEALSSKQFADALAHMMEARTRLLKILSLNLYDMENYCRLDTLVEFKRVYGRTLECITLCLKKFFPSMTGDDINGFIYAFFPFIFGIYPYTEIAPKQAKAMKKAGLNCTCHTIYEITEPVVYRLLQRFD